MTHVIRDHCPTDMLRRPDCEHGNIEGFCFECMPIEEQEASRAMWARFENDPRFVEGMAKAAEEIAKGQVIRTKRRGAEGVVLVMPYSFFRTAVDIIHEDKMRRGETDD